MFQKHGSSDDDDYRRHRLQVLAICRLLAFTAPRPEKPSDARMFGAVCNRRDTHAQPILPASKS